jgi:DNA-binding MarR family transcriptional regulator
MAAARGHVTVNQRILVHLLGHVRWLDRGDAPPQVTQQGIADALRVRRSHVTLALQALAQRGLVEYRTTRVVGGARRKKAYGLTPIGYERAQETRALLASILDRLPDGVLPRGPESVRPSEIADLLPHLPTLAARPA